MMTTSLNNKRLKIDHGGKFLKPQYSGDSATQEEKTENEELLLRHLTWTAKQGLILTGGGKAEELYTDVRGFPFEEDECPHYHLLKRSTNRAFQAWKSSSASNSALVTGVWNRTLFVGGWNNTTDRDETVYNIQTHNLFVDMRIPKTRSLVLSRGASSLYDLRPPELKLYARQHIFAGFTLSGKENDRPLCTRHHCIDWNFVGAPRKRPNKWHVEINPENPNVWKEHSYAKDDNGQDYYWEQWERISNKNIPRLAIRKSYIEKGDGILVAIGDHFNYAMARILDGHERQYPQAKSLVDLVDAAVSVGDLHTARSYLSTRGGHGRVSSGCWRVDCSISPWDEGKVLWGKGDIQVLGKDVDSCHVLWNGEKWDVYDCSFQNVQDLRFYLVGRSGSDMDNRHSKL